MTIITQDVFVRGATVPIHADVKNWSGAYIDPTNGLKTTIYKPDGTAAEEDKPMTQDESGRYVYYFQTSSDSDEDTWEYEVTAQDGSGDGAKFTIARGSFKLV